MADLPFPKALAGPDPKLGLVEDPRQLGLFSAATCDRCGCSAQKRCSEADSIGPGRVCSVCLSKAQGGTGGKP